ncbi:MAG: hypothetical protein ACKOU6_20700, partial [Planctomycetota bacterium]
MSRQVLICAVLLAGLVGVGCYATAAYGQSGGGGPTAPPVPALPPPAGEEQPAGPPPVTLDSVNAKADTASLAAH